MKKLALLPFVISYSVWAALPLLPIPRHLMPDYFLEGAFEGGGDVRANLETIRFAAHAGLEYERWELEFSSLGTRKLAATAPRFQLRYEAANETHGPRFLVLLKGVENNYLNQTQLRAAVKNSRLLKDIVVYPQIENGDLALEISLRSAVAFQAIQPESRPGRLLLDLRKRDFVPQLQ